MVNLSILSADSCNASITQKGTYGKHTLLTAETEKGKLRV